MNYLMAIDAGTGSVRSVIFDVNGNQAGCVQKEWKHPEDPRFPGSMNFDWNANWNLTCSCIKEVLTRTGVSAAQIAAVSTTCMREGIVLYNSKGEELWACANVDARAKDEVALLKQIDPQIEKEIYLKSGQTFALGALPRLLWVKKKLPDIYAQTAYIGMINDWIIFKLSGVLAVEPSNGSTTGLFDLKTRRWDIDIARRCGLRDDIFPDVIECGEVAAKVSKTGEEQSGLIAGTPLVCGGGDCQLGTIGVGVVEKSEAVVFGGSFWQYEFNTDSGVCSPRCDVRVNCHAVPNLWQYEALAFNPGLVMRWFRDAFCDLEKKEAAEKNTDPYLLMDDKALSVPAGSHGIICTFSDVMNYINWKHASPAFINFDLNPVKFNKAAFYRAILENACLVTLGHIKLVQEATGKHIQKIVFAGGAAKSKLWPQILADVIGIQVDVPVVKEATALGAAIMAGKGIGFFHSISEAARTLVKIEKTFSPDAKNREVYDKAYDNWKAVYKPMLKLSDEKLTRYMWCAPGL
ncbi:MAG: autoinducer-2 kinase [Treponema sp.]|nr:autoinducer-2 kinase [Treponema sp.]MCL2272546.1 autoinducer-2 kinase [Treponema sp.]